MNFDNISEKILIYLRKNLKRCCNDKNSISYTQMNEMLKNNSNAILLDVRSIQEYNEGHLNGAINIPLSELKEKANCILKNYDNIIIAYCQYGARSEKAVNILKKLGYNKVYSLCGGLSSLS